MSAPCYADAVKKNLKPRSKAGCKPIQNLFKAVVSLKDAPPCSKEGCKTKAQYGFSAPPSFCADDKSEGIHQITIEEMKSIVSDHDILVTEVIPYG